VQNENKKSMQDKLISPKLAVRIINNSSNECFNKLFEIY